MFLDFFVIKKICVRRIWHFDNVLNVRTSVHVIMMHVLTLHRISDIMLQNYAPFLVTKAY